MALRLEARRQHADVSAQRFEQILADRLVQDRIREALEELPEEFRLAVILCDLYDFSYKEIADILDCPVGTVMSRLYRGRRLLQESLFQYAAEQGYIQAPGEADAPASLDDYRKQKKVR